MGIYSEEYVAVLHEAADSIIDKHKLEGISLEHNPKARRSWRAILHQCGITSNNKTSN